MEVLYIEVECCKTIEVMYNVMKWPTEQCSVASVQCTTEESSEQLEQCTQWSVMQSV